MPASKNATETVAPETTEAPKSKVSPEDVKMAQGLVDKYNGQKSGPIRVLAEAGWSTGRIARTLTQVFYADSDREVRYQHVRNVLVQAASKKA